MYFEAPLDAFATMNLKSPTYLQTQISIHTPNVHNVWTTDKRCEHIKQILKKQMVLNNIGAV